MAIGTAQYDEQPDLVAALRTRAIKAVLVAGELDMDGIRSDERPDLALIDATRAVSLFAQAGVPMVGLVENMAGYACPHCGEISDPFGQGGAEREAPALSMPFLGRVPLAIDIRRQSDSPNGGYNS